MLTEIHVVAGSHCPPVRQIHDAMSNSSNSGSYLPTAAALENILNSEPVSGDQESSSGDSPPNLYASTVPNLFTRRQDILQQGLFYGNASRGAASLSQAARGVRLSIHFFIEPSLSHLNRHFSSLSLQAQEQLQRGYIPSGWVQPLLAVKDASGSASVYAWNLQTIENWRHDFLTMISGRNFRSKKVDTLRYEPHPESMFNFDRKLDQSRFELELDAIDSLPDLILKE